MYNAILYDKYKLFLQVYFTWPVLEFWFEYIKYQNEGFLLTNYLSCQLKLHTVKQLVYLTYTDYNMCHKS